MAGEADMFNSLPEEEIIDRILSFLAIDDLFRLSATSKTCRDLCLSAKTFNIDFSKKSEFSSKYPIFTCLDRFFLRRSPGKKITNLDIQTSTFLCDHDFCDADQLLTLVLQAVPRGLQNLKLKFCPVDDEAVIDTLYLPLEIYRCQTLTDFALDLGTGSKKKHHFGIAATISFVNLTSLHLKRLRIKIKDEKFGEWISACKTLKKLELENVRGVEKIDIKSSSLEHVRIANYTPVKLAHWSVLGETVKSIDLKWIPDLYRDEKTALKITAPNLEFFKWQGHLIPDEILHEASNDYFFERNYEVTKLKYVQFSINTNELILGGRTIKYLYECHCFNSGAYIEVEKLCIVIDYGLDYYFFPPAIAQLLKGIRKLKSLCIQSNAEEYNEGNYPPPHQVHDMEYWEKNLEWKTFLKLKKVEIEVLNGGSELELAKYLLANAKQLKEMTILQNGDHDRLSKFKKMVLEYRTSTKASVVFK